MSYYQTSNRLAKEYAAVGDYANLKKVLEDSDGILSSTILKAANLRYPNIIQLLLDHGVGDTNNDIFHILMRAIERGHMSTVLYLLKRGDLDKRYAFFTSDEDISAYIERACRPGRLDMVKLLLARLNTEQWNTMWALATKYAVLYGHIEMLDFLVAQSDTDLDELFYDWVSNCISGKQHAMLKHILQYYIKSGHNTTPWHRWIKFSETPEFLWMLMEYVPRKVKMPRDTLQFSDDSFPLFLNTGRSTFRNILNDSWLYHLCSENSRWLPGCKRSFRLISLHFSKKMTKLLDTLPKRINQQQLELKTYIQCMESLGLLGLQYEKWQWDEGTETWVAQWPKQVPPSTLSLAALCRRYYLRYSGLIPTSWYYVLTIKPCIINMWHPELLDISKILEHWRTHPLLASDLFIKQFDA